MRIEGSVALVTGANRGLGGAYVEALLQAAAAKVYVGARQPIEAVDERCAPLALDVTSDEAVMAAAARCGDVDLLINNAGILASSSMLDAGSDDAMRRELEVNLFGTLRMCRAFSPILARNGGGAIVNVLSVVSWFTAPFNATYCASKHAALALTDSVRIELKQQGTQVVGVFAGLIDTDMVKRSAQPKTPPSQVAARTLEGLRAGADQVLADSRAEEIWRSMRSDPARLAAAMQAAWLASGR